MNSLTLLAIAVVVVVFWIYSIYASVIRKRNKAQEAFSSIDVQLKKRYDLIPNLVETVKGYAKHEKETLEGVIEARNKAVTANSINEKVDAENQITGALNKLFALSEAYPELKANENFKSLQNELKEVEDKIAYSRQFYNDTAMSYNNIVAMFPSNIVANMFKFKSYDYFKIDEKERENVKVKF